MNVCFEDMNRLADDLACAAATHSLTDTKADSRRDRDGPERDVREFGAHQTKNPRALPWGFLILLCLPLKLVSDASANRIDRKITPSERNR